MAIATRDATDDALSTAAPAESPAAEKPVFEVQRRSDFPRLGWLCELEDSHRVMALAGTDVEVFPLGLVEGCWDGPFEALDFFNRPNLFGSGVSWQEQQFWFSPPAHTLDCLYAMWHRGRRLVSNSLFLLYRESGAELNVNHNYTKRLFTLSSGIDDAEAIIYESAETVLHRILYDDFMFEHNGPRRRRKPDVQVPFTRYSEYRDYVVGVIRRCADNATAPGRRRCYRLISTISSGYDSTAAAALGKAAGCDTVITLRSGRLGLDDSGRPAAQALGLDCVERERRDPRQRTAASEIEFLMTGTGGADYPMAAFEDVLGGALCLTGYTGDKMWDRVHQPTTNLSFGGNSGASLAEFRLRVGFLHLPVPFVAGRRHPDLFRISQDPEMSPWTIGGDYDRPIARRIIEEAGVPRGAFARDKRAMAMIFSWGPMFLSDQVKEPFSRFLRQEGLRARVYAAQVGFHLGHLVFRLVRKVTVKANLRGLLGGLVARLHRRYRAFENTPFANLLFIWALREAISAAPRNGAQGSGTPS